MGNKIHRIKFFFLILCLSDVFSAEADFPPPFIAKNENKVKNFSSSVVIKKQENIENLSPNITYTLMPFPPSTRGKKYPLEQSLGRVEEAIEAEDISLKFYHTAFDYTPLSSASALSNRALSLTEEVEDISLKFYHTAFDYTPLSSASALSFTELLDIKRNLLEEFNKCTP